MVETGRLIQMLAGVLVGLAPLLPYLAYERTHSWGGAHTLLQLAGQHASLDGMALGAFLQVTTGAGLDTLESVPHDQFTRYPHLFAAHSVATAVVLLLSIAVAAIWCGKGWGRKARPAVRRQSRYLLILLGCMCIPLLLSFRHSVPVHPHYELILFPAPFVWDYGVPYATSARIAALGRQAAPTGNLWLHTDAVIQPMLAYLLRDVPARPDLPANALVLPPAGVSAGYIFDDVHTAYVAQALEDAGATTLGRMSYLDGLHQAIILTWRANARADQLGAALHPLPVRLDRVAPGRYDLRAEMYRRPSIQRVPAIDATGQQQDGEFPLGMITIGSYAPDNQAWRSEAARGTGDLPALPLLLGSCRVLPSDQLHVARERSDANDWDPLDDRRYRTRRLAWWTDLGFVGRHFSHLAGHRGCHHHLQPLHRESLQVDIAESAGTSHGSVAAWRRPRLRYALGPGGIWMIWFDEHVTRATGVQGGDAILKGTRTPVRTVIAQARVYEGDLTEVHCRASPSDRGPNPRRAGLLRSSHRRNRC